MSGVCPTLHICPRHSILSPGRKIKAGCPPFICFCDTLVMSESQRQFRSNKSRGRERKGLWINKSLLSNKNLKIKISEGNNLKFLLFWVGGAKIRPAGGGWRMARGGYNSVRKKSRTLISLLSNHLSVSGCPGRAPRPA